MDKCWFVKPNNETNGSWAVLGNRLLPSTSMFVEIENFFKKDKHSFTK